MISQKVKEKVLIICYHNSSRSQMAEGLLKTLYNEYYEVYSAGSDPSIVNHYAIKVLAELDVDISNNRSKSLKEFEGLEFDYVVTVCGGFEAAACPFFPGGKKYLHQSFEDPAAVKGTDQDKTEAFRRSRDEIKEWIKETFRKSSEY